MKKMLICLIILSTLLMTGCWDMVEIEDRIFPYTIGIDMNSNKEKEGKLDITISYPNIAAIGKNAQSDDPIFVVNDTSNSIFQLLHKLTTRLQRPIYLKLLNVIVLSEEVAKDGKTMMEILDGLNRDFVISKNVQMLITRESSKDLIETSTEAKRQQSIEGYIHSMLVNRQAATMFIPINFIQFVEEMDISNASMVPLGRTGEEEIIVEGGALFKDFKLVGYLEPMEVAALGIIRENIREDSVDVNFHGSDLSALITSVKSRRELENKEDKIKIKYNIELEGQLQSFVLYEKMSIETSDMVESIQDAIAKDVMDDVNKLVEKVQKELKVDILHIGNYISKFHPQLWRQIQDEWTELYPDIEIDFDIEVFIRRRGLTK